MMAKTWKLSVHQIVAYITAVHSSDVQHPENRGTKISP